MRIYCVYGSVTGFVCVSQINFFKRKSLEDRKEDMME